MEGGCGGNPNSYAENEDSNNNNNNNTNNNNNNNNNGSLCSTMMMMNHNSSTATTATDDHDLDHHNNSNKLFHQLPLMTMMMPSQQQNQQQEEGTGDLISHSIKAKIMAHPHFPRLLTSYVSCQKVGAPEQVVTRLEEACASGEAMSRSAAAGAGGGHLGQDPTLDQFMEAYCEMLSKYEQELTKPFHEALLFLSDIDSKLKTLSLLNPPHNLSAGLSASSEEEIDVNDHYIDPLAEDTELKHQLLRRYSGSLGSLKQDFMKKKKKGKLPKEARQKLLDWWSRHHRWPYPSEQQKIALVESTGLDPKQINNWFINQRKRHWKPSEDMQFVVMDAAYPQFYMENAVGNAFSMDHTTTAHF